MVNKCLVRGSINVDEFFHLPHIVRPGETISSVSLSRGAGGKGANQAYAVAKAGGNVVLAGHIGLDGLWVRELLQEGGVQVDKVEVLKDEVTGRAVIQSSADGENSIILHKGANYHYPSDTTPRLDGITHLVLQNEIDPRITTAYLSAAASRGITSIYNPSPMPSPDELRSFPWKALSWLIVNEGEMGDLLAAFGIAHDAGADTEDVALESLTKRVTAGLGKLSGSSSFAPSVNVICTLGAQGIMYFVAPSDGAEAKVGHLPAAKVVNGVKDTTGAGDCFAGYFAAGLMDGAELEVVLKTCLTASVPSLDVHVDLTDSQACAMCVEKPGAMGSVPSRAEVEERLA